MINTMHTVFNRPFFLQLLKVRSDGLLLTIRRRRYLFGSNSITNDKIRQISRARLPENPEVNYAGHQHIQFLFYLETTTTTTILLKHTKKQIQKK